MMQRSSRGYAIPISVKVGNAQVPPLSLPYLAHILFLLLLDVPGIDSKRHHILILDQRFSFFTTEISAAMHLC